MKCLSKYAVKLTLDIDKYQLLSLMYHLKLLLKQDSVTEFLTV